MNELMEKCTIYTLNARTSIYFNLMNAVFNMSGKEMLDLINNEYALMVKILHEKGIEYKDLRCILEPPHKANKREYLFCFDAEQSDSGWYSNEIMNEILPLLDKKRKHAVLHGDYCVERQYNEYAFTVLQKNLELVKELPGRDCRRYYFVYINNMIEEELKVFVKCLGLYKGFIGYGEMTYANELKDYLAYCLGGAFLQINGKILLSHEDDVDNAENRNTIGFSFEKFGFKYCSIQTRLYVSFLEYKIESRAVEKSDLLFSLNAISSHPENFSEYEIVLDEPKFNYIKDKNKAIVQAVGIDKMTTTDFIEFVREKIKYAYIYGLEVNNHNIMKFHIQVEVYTDTIGKARFLLVFSYEPASKVLKIINAM